MAWKNAPSGNELWNVQEVAIPSLGWASLWPAASVQVCLLNSNFQTTAAASNTELARLQVLVRNSQVQEEHLKQDNLELRAQLDAAEKALVQARKDAVRIALYIILELGVPIHKWTIFH